MYVVLDMLFNVNDTVAVESRVRKCFRAVIATVSCLGGKVSSDKSWMRIVDVQLFPVLWYCTFATFERNQSKYSTRKNL